MLTNASEILKMHKRLTWTLFHLPPDQTWPAWPSSISVREDLDISSYLGPLSNVAGLENVRLGRRVEDPEQAAFIICEYIASSIVFGFLACTVCLRRCAREEIDPTEYILQL